MADRKKSGSDPRPAHTVRASGDSAAARVYVGDCRDLLRRIPECAPLGPQQDTRWANGGVQLIFADPPFNWNVKYDKWHDAMPREDYLDFTRAWLDACIDALTPSGALWVNIPDDTAAEIVVHLKSRGMTMGNWCIWHYRFGQNTQSWFINSKVHALYFVKDADNRIWNADDVLEPSDRATTYFDPRTIEKKEGKAGLRLPMDVWYGQYWGRIQGNNKERRANHMNQIPEVYLERVILATSNPGDVVLDPFLGSGTTATVARALGRPAIGIEFSAENAQSAAERIRKGPVRVGLARNQSTAIFAPRGVSERALAQYRQRLSEASET
ncbi:MAG: site-specific DNA-methyltransferase [Phycisphaerales bacterium]|nr:site-specific DNA-methyltransferase [Phycisphaerales bacterium]